MVRRRLLLPLLAGLAALAALAVAAPARASLLPPSQPPSNPPVTDPGGTSSSSGTPTYGHARNCSLYANASSFGLTCTHGAGDVQAKTVKQVLHGDPPPGCWDEPISAADQVQKYGLPAAPEGTAYYLHYCVTDLDLDAPVGTQAALQLNVEIVEIPTPAKPCPKPYKPEMRGECVMTLTDNQRQVVELSQLAGGQIPDIIVVQQPSTRVRTNQPIAYQNRGANGDTRTATYQAGAVRMWAEMTSYTISPYGPGTDPRIACDGSIKLDDSATPAGSPKACWWTYPRSSAQQPGHTYPLRAEADWTVYVDDGAGARAFAQFRKFDDLKLPVYDIQTLVVH
ncbi:MAG TPA: hypothetical protein VHC23_13635 [Jatrophihabitans sp.]|nr:hypothetical protein [Jatrophihabitans sp.]